MNPRIARWAGWTMVAAALLSFALLYLLSSGKLLVSQRGALGGSLVKVEFRNAWPLVPGMTVRVSGAVAGTVESVDLTDEGTADVGLRLTRDIPVPRADASAAIRQHDILGDTYVALELGDDDRQLEGAIPATRTLALPRLDELFSTFREPERKGMQVLLTELGLSVERRGGELNEAMLQLRPGLEALDDLLAELDTQENDLRDVVDDASRLTSRLAASTGEIDRSTVAVDELATSAAARTAQLDRALRAAPRGMAATRRALAQVSELSDRAQPLARTLAETAPELRASAPLIAPFSRDAAASVQALSPAVRRLRRTLVAGERVTPLLSGLSPVDVLLPAAGLLEVLSPVFGDGATALFGASNYGTSPQGQSGLGAVAVERGDQPSTPDVDPRRMWMRTGVVLTCESFGVPIRPGCLARLLGQGVDLLMPVNLRAGRKPVAEKQPASGDPDLQILDYLMR